MQERVGVGVKRREGEGVREERKEKRAEKEGRRVWL